MSYPQTNEPPAQMPQPQPPAQQPAPPAQQQRGPVVVHTAPQDNTGLSAQINEFGQQIQSLPDRMVQALREAMPPQQPPAPQQPPQGAQQPPAQQPQQPPSSASPQPASPATGSPPSEQLPPGMGPTRARVLRSFFGR